MVEDSVEEVVLLDEHGNRVGLAEKFGAHNGETPLHLAFSCYIFDQAGRLLVTQRAVGKKVFPGVWTNSVCGHPADGEPLEAAVRRRAQRELGLELDELRLVLPQFRYRAELDGIVENEICPVLMAQVSNAELEPAADEVETYEWVDWQEFAGSVLAGERKISPWCRLQVERLTELGANPMNWPAADPALLPPALQF